FHNGVASVFNNPVGYQGDGNGIKLGHDSGTHVLENMLIFSNSANGVDINGNATQLEGDPPTSIPHGVTVYNTTAALNGGKNFQFDENPTTASPPTTHTLRNDVSYTGSTTVLTGNTADHNTFNGPAGSPAGLGDSAADFVSTAIPVTTWDSFHAAGTGGDRSGTTTPTFATGAAVAPRLADGSLPPIDFMRLASGSHLIDAGVNVGLAYNGLAPDLGWSESSSGTPGDYDANGVVDLRDYIVWRDNRNSNVILPNDATPGAVDASDYDVWRSNFNPAVSGGAGSALETAVPEPISLIELVAVVLLLPIMRRRTSTLACN
ncbi:MAG TPA: hypothetical protein VH107_05045, partial [Lacipirellulaceae bacterium]|nr:hypothetical protein [Lacipirellulaceae bacterium]